jgi:uncharacterized phage protein (TIGR01671 family)
MSSFEQLRSDLYWNFEDIAKVNQGASKAILMQYTGLKDKNGKEIYEGDILRTMDCSIPYAPVILQAVKYMPHLGSFVLYTSINKDTEWDEMIHQAVTDRYCNLADSEIIGNIYENPELIPNLQ